jgi:hypothetical protein
MAYTALYKAGKVRAIGVGNYCPSCLECLLGPGASAANYTSTATNSAAAAAAAAAGDVAVAPRGEGAGDWDVVVPAVNQVLGEREPSEESR